MFDRSSQSSRLDAGWPAANGEAGALDPKIQQQPLSPPGGAAAWPAAVAPLLARLLTQERLATGWGCPPANRSPAAPGSAAKSLLGAQQGQPPASAPQVAEQRERRGEADEPASDGWASGESEPATGGTSNAKVVASAPSPAVMSPEREGQPEVVVVDRGSSRESTPDLRPPDSAATGAAIEPAPDPSAEGVLPRSTRESGGPNCDAADLVRYLVTVNPDVYARCARRCPGVLTALAQWAIESCGATDDADVSALQRLLTCGLLDIDLQGRPMLEVVSAAADGSAEGQRRRALLRLRCESGDALCRDPAEPFTSASAGCVDPSCLLRSRRADAAPASGPARRRYSPAGDSYPR